MDLSCRVNTPIPSKLSNQLSLMNGVFNKSTNPTHSELKPMKCPKCTKDMNRDGFEKGSQRWKCSPCSIRTAKSEEWFQLVEEGYKDYLVHRTPNKVEVNTGLGRQNILNWLKKGRTLSYEEYKQSINPFIKLGWVENKANGFRNHVKAVSDRYDVVSHRKSFRLLYHTDDETWVELARFNKIRYRVLIKLHYNYRVNLYLNQEYSSPVILSGKEQSTKRNWWRLNAMTHEEKQFDNLFMSSLTTKVFTDRHLQDLLEYL